MSETVAIYTPSSLGGPLRQGEVLAGLIQARLRTDTIATEGPIVVMIEHPLAIVMSQDCDLDWDFRARFETPAPGRLIPNILFCEVMEASRLRGATGINSAIWRRIEQNKDERYQFLQGILPEQDALGEGLPELGLDFKRYFTIPTDEVYVRLQISAQRRCRLISPYREHLSTRFYGFQSRVALPADHMSA